MSEAANDRPIFRSAIIGAGRIGSTYDDEITDRRTMEFYQGAMRHPGLYTILPVNHADAYLGTPGFQLIAGANRGEAKLRAFGERTGVRALYTDVYQMLRDQRPDVVSVCTQSPEKAELTIAAAEAGVKAVIVEKAMATSMAEADAMIGACRDHGTLLIVNHPNRFSPINRRIKQLIDDGEIGPLGIVAAYARGGMMHIGTHTFDVMRYWAGDVTEVDARVPDYVPDKDIPASGTLRFKNGVLGTFDHVQGVLRGYEVRGTTGFITTSGLVGDSWLFKSQPLSPVNASTGGRKSFEQLKVSPIDGEPHTMSLTQRLLTEVHQALTIGSPLVSTGEDGAAALEIGLACYASHLAGGPVRLPLDDRALRVPNR